MALKILVVEDDVDFSKTLMEFLDESGFKSINVNSAEEAEEIFKKREFDLVLTDIKLPGMDGIKLVKNIKKKYNLAVIVMTAYSSEYSFEDVIKNGANDLIFKPFKLNELLLRINRVLKEISLVDDHEKMIKALKRLTIEDSLTGLYNSRHFYDQLDKEIKRSARYLRPISIIFIDVDNFKGVNDTFGHMIGDKVLSLIAQKLKASLRSYDTAYRFAGRGARLRPLPGKRPADHQALRHLRGRRPGADRHQEQPDLLHHRAGGPRSGVPRLGRGGGRGWWPGPAASGRQRRSDHDPRPRRRRDDRSGAAGDRRTPGRRRPRQGRPGGRYCVESNQDCHRSL